jgi:FAD/FMN-containing dehydrogenase
MTRNLPPELIEQIGTIVGPKGCLTDPEDLQPYLDEQRGYFESFATLVVRPEDTVQVAKVVEICAAAGVPIVPQGGNTGLTGGAVADAGEIIVNLSRLNRVRAIDPINDTITVEAGCTLSQVQAAAADAERLFPLSLASEGSCQIGGNLSSNAGGNAVLRYGNARELALGLEVVLPDGRILNGLRGLRKDNTGYDLKQLFLGAEGTLGIITAAVCRLFPMPRETETAFVALNSVHAATDLFSLARGLGGETVSAFELMSRRTLEFVLKNVSTARDPLEAAYDWYVLMEVSTARRDSGLRGALEEILGAGFEKELIVDGVIAESGSQQNDLWHLREAASDAQKPEGMSLKHDISVPVSKVAAFVTQACAAVEAEISGIRPVVFGHVGDGNVHFNLTQPESMDGKEYLARQKQIGEIVHGIAAEMDGSISAEHGIGLLKRDEVRKYKSETELDLMRALKACLDPKDTMNPGKVV